jgi:hypothetical protein
MLTDLIDFYLEHKPPHSPGSSFESNGHTCHSHWDGPGIVDGMWDLDTCYARRSKRLGLAFGLGGSTPTYLSTMPEGAICEARCIHELDRDGVHFTPTYMTATSVRTFECNDGVGNSWLYLNPVLSREEVADSRSYHLVDTTSICFEPWSMLFQTAALLRP